MISQAKEYLRDAIPTRYQVPIKYFYNRMLGKIEDEMELLPLLADRNGIVLDVGGNRGNYSYVLSKIGCDVKVFEPNEKCFTVLQEWAKGKARVEVFPCGLSSSPGEAELLVPIDASGIEHDSSASLEHEPEAAASMRRQKVELRTIDGFGFKNVAFIKIDVEGHEESVVRGATQTIEAFHPAFLIEVENRHRANGIGEFFRLMEGFGYEIYFWKSGKLCPISQFDPERDQASCNLGQKGGVYINNFIFLNSDRVRNGEYANLLSKG